VRLHALSHPVNFPVSFRQHGESVTILPPDVL